MKLSELQKLVNHALERGLPGDTEVTSFAGGFYASFVSQAAVTKTPGGREVLVLITTKHDPCVELLGDMSIYWLPPKGE